jgi:hypothetical protein
MQELHDERALNGINNSREKLSHDQVLGLKRTYSES